MDLNLIDYDTDCYDPNSHMNPSGAWKITDHMGQILRKDYNLPDHRGEDGYEYWDEDYTIYADVKKDRLNNIKDLNTYLMLLEDKNYVFLMCVANPLVFEDLTTMNLLKNKGVDTLGIDKETKYIYVGKDKIRVYKTENLAKKELFNREKDDFSVSDNQIKITVFDSNNPSDVINESVFSVPNNDNINERTPDANGVILLNSRITRS